MRILIVSNYYNQFIDDLYARNPDLGGAPYDEQLRRVMEVKFGVSDSYSRGLRRIGCEAIDVISNISPLQRQWATENGFSIPEVRTWHHDVIEAQARAFRPDVLFVFEYNPVGDDCLARLKSFARLMVGQIASNLPPHRTFAAYDLIVSSWRPIVEHFRTHGKRGELLRLGFDDDVLNRIGPAEEKWDVTFVGGLASCHRDRIAMLEDVARRVDVDVWGYVGDELPAGAALRRRHHGPAWGMDMYRVLRDSRITVNVHGEIAVGGTIDRRFANNMRLYEATGVGTMLLTDVRQDLADMFEPDVELLSFSSADECVDLIRECLADGDRRRSIARAGQRRTLRDHTYASRMAELHAALCALL